LTSWLKFVLKMVGLVVFFILLALVMLYAQQESVLYVPKSPIQYTAQNPPRYQSPSERGMHFKEVWLNSKDGTKLQGWFLHHDTRSKDMDTVVFLHENAGNIGLRMDWMELLYKHLHVNLLVVAYRGYSGSEGEPSQEGLLMDADAMVAFCKSEPKIN